MRSTATALIIMVAGAFDVTAEPVYSHFGFCATPQPPTCAMGARTAETQSCRDEVESYVAQVFRYRACLSAEMERAVREANTVIYAVKCGAAVGSCDPNGSSKPSTFNPDDSGVGAKR